MIKDGDIMEISPKKINTTTSSSQRCKRLAIYSQNNPLETFTKKLYYNENSLLYQGFQFQYSLIIRKLLTVNQWNGKYAFQGSPFMGEGYADRGEITPTIGGRIDA